MSNFIAKQNNLHINQEYTLISIVDALKPDFESIIIKGIFDDSNFMNFNMIIDHELSEKLFPKNYYISYYFSSYDAAENFAHNNLIDVKNISVSEERNILKWINIEMLLYRLISYIAIIKSGIVIY